VSFWSSPEGADRGQTEPLAALIAIATLALALAVYGGYVGDLLPDQSDRSVEEPTLESVWGTVGDDGVYHDDELQTEDVPAARLPKGYYVYANVTVLTPDGWEQRDSALYTPLARRASPSLKSEINANGPPDGASATSRVVPYETDDGEVRSARLTVVVWDG